MELQQLINDINKYCEEGKRKQLSPLLKTLVENRRQYYQESIAEYLENELSDVFFKSLVLDIDEDEEESIEVAELSYIGLNTTLAASPEEPDFYKRRLLLLHYFSDYFTDALIDIFLKKYRDDNLLPARNLIIECIDKMQVADMFFLEENFPGYIDNDTQLSDACNAINLTEDFTEENQNEFELMHKVLHAYLKVKYKKTES